MTVHARSLLVAAALLAIAHAGCGDDPSGGEDDAASATGSSDAGTGAQGAGGSASSAGDPASSTGAGASGATGGGPGSGGGGGVGAASACGIPIVLEDFEDGEFTDTLDHEPGAGAVAVVSSEGGAHVWGGTRCLRGNFKEGYTDPLTGLQAPTHYSGIEIPLGGSERFYLSVRYRIDPDAQWVMDDGNDTGLGYKFFYLMGTPWNNTLNWVLAQLWGPDFWWFGDNQPFDSTGYQTDADAAPAQATLGEWHHIELVVGLNSGVGATDGRFLLRIDGTVVIDRNDVPFQTSTPQTFGTLGGVPMMYGGCCSAKYPFGWQIDNLEVYELPEGCEPP